MTRSATTARRAGANTEARVAEYLRNHVSRFIDVMPQHGSKDRGDVLNVETRHEEPVCVEVKDYGGKLKVGTWLAEAETERINLKALIGLVIAKRRGTTDVGQYYVLATVNDLVALLTGERP